MENQDRELTSRYANLTASEDPSAVNPAPVQPQAQQIVIGSDDLKVITELKAKGNLEAIGEYVSNLLP